MRIVTAPGQVIEIGTVVLRDGLIDAAGVDVAVPVDAQLIPTEAGWTVYAAFVDAASMVGLEAAPEATPRGGAQAEPHGVPHELQSVHPERAVVDRIDAGHTSIERHRDMGFAVAHVLPRTGVFRGESTVMLLRLAPRHVGSITSRMGGTTSTGISDTSATAQGGAKPIISSSGTAR